MKKNGFFCTGTVEYVQTWANYLKLIDELELLKQKLDPQTLTYSNLDARITIAKENLSNFRDKWMKNVENPEDIAVLFGKDFIQKHTHDIQKPLLFAMKIPRKRKIIARLTVDNGEVLYSALDPETFTFQDNRALDFEQNPDIAYQVLDSISLVTNNATIGTDGVLQVETELSSVDGTKLDKNGNLYHPNNTSRKAKKSQINAKVYESIIGRATRKDISDRLSQGRINVMTHAWAMDDVPAQFKRSNDPLGRIPYTKALNTAFSYLQRGSSDMDGKEALKRIGDVLINEMGQEPTNFTYEFVARHDEGSVTIPQGNNFTEYTNKVKLFVRALGPNGQVINFPVGMTEIGNAQEGGFNHFALSLKDQGEILLNELPIDQNHLVRKGFNSNITIPDAIFTKYEKNARGIKSYLQDMGFRVSDNIYIIRDQSANNVTGVQTDVSGRSFILTSTNPNVDFQEAITEAADKNLYGQLGEETIIQELKKKGINLLFLENAPVSHSSIIKSIKLDKRRKESFERQPESVKKLIQEYWKGEGVPVWDDGTRLDGSNFANPYQTQYIHATLLKAYEKLTRDANLSEDEIAFLQYFRESTPLRYFKAAYFSNTRKSLDDLSPEKRSKITSDVISRHGLLEYVGAVSEESLRLAQNRFAEDNLGHKSEIAENAWGNIMDAVNSDKLDIREAKANGLKRAHFRKDDGSYETMVIQTIEVNGEEIVIKAFDSNGKLLPEYQNLSVKVEQLVANPQNYNLLDEIGDIWHEVSNSNGELSGTEAFGYNYGNKVAFKVMMKLLEKHWDKAGKKAFQDGKLKDIGGKEYQWTFNIKRAKDNSENITNDDGETVLYKISTEKDSLGDTTLENTSFRYSVPQIGLQINFQDIQKKAENSIQESFTPPTNETNTENSEITPNTQENTNNKIDEDENFDEDFNEDEDFDFKTEEDFKLTEYEYISAIEARQIVESLLGTDVDIRFHEELVVSGKRRLGYVRNKIIGLNTNKGRGVEGFTARHESFHYVMNYLLSPESYRKVINEGTKAIEAAPEQVRNRYVNNDGTISEKMVNEFLADRFERHHLRQKSYPSWVPKFIQELLGYIRNLYLKWQGKHIDVLFNQIDGKRFVNRPSVYYNNNFELFKSDEDAAKAVNLYKNPELLKAFGSKDGIKQVVNQVKNGLMANFYKLNQIERVTPMHRAFKGYASRMKKSIEKQEDESKKRRAQTVYNHLSEIAQVAFPNLDFNASNSVQFEQQNVQKQKSFFEDEQPDAKSNATEGLNSLIEYFTLLKINANGKVEAGGKINAKDARNVMLEIAADVRKDVVGTDGDYKSKFKESFKKYIESKKGLRKRVAFSLYARFFAEPGETIAGTTFEDGAIEIAGQKIYSFQRVINAKYNGDIAPEVRKAMIARYLPAVNALTTYILSIQDNQFSSINNKKNKINTETAAKFAERAIKRRTFERYYDVWGNQAKINLNAFEKLHLSFQEISGLFSFKDGGVQLGNYSYDAEKVLINSNDKKRLKNLVNTLFDFGDNHLMADALIDHYNETTDAKRRAISEFILRSVASHYENAFQEYKNKEVPDQIKSALSLREFMLGDGDTREMWKMGPTHLGKPSYIALSDGKDTSISTIKDIYFPLDSLAHRAEMNLLTDLFEDNTILEPDSTFYNAQGNRVSRFTLQTSLYNRIEEINHTEVDELTNRPEANKIYRNPLLGTKKITGYTRIISLDNGNAKGDVKNDYRAKDFTDMSERDTFAYMVRGMLQKGRNYTHRQTTLSDKKSVHHFDIQNEITDADFDNIYKKRFADAYFRIKDFNEAAKDLNDRYGLAIPQLVMPNITHTQKIAEAFDQLDLAINKLGKMDMVVVNPITGETVTVKGGYLKASKLTKNKDYVKYKGDYHANSLLKYELGQSRKQFSKMIQDLEDRFIDKVRNETSINVDANESELRKAYRQYFANNFYLDELLSGGDKLYKHKVKVKDGKDYRKAVEQAYIDFVKRNARLVAPMAMVASEGEMLNRVTLTDTDKLVGSKRVGSEGTDGLSLMNGLARAYYHYGYGARLGQGADQLMKSTGVATDKYTKDSSVAITPQLQQNSMQLRLMNQYMLLGNDAAIGKNLLDLYEQKYEQWQQNQLNGVDIFEDLYLDLRTYWNDPVFGGHTGQELFANAHHFYKFQSGTKVGERQVHDIHTLFGKDESGNAEKTFSDSWVQSAYSSSQVAAQLHQVANLSSEQFIATEEGKQLEITKSLDKDKEASMLTQLLYIVGLGDNYAQASNVYKNLAGFSEQEYAQFQKNIYKKGRVSGEQAKKALGINSDHIYAHIKTAIKKSVGLSELFDSDTDRLARINSFLRNDANLQELIQLDYNQLREYKRALLESSLKEAIAQMRVQQGQNTSITKVAMDENMPVALPILSNEIFGVLAGKMSKALVNFKIAGFKFTIAPATDFVYVYERQGRLYTLADAEAEWKTMGDGQNFPDYLNAQFVSRNVRYSQPVDGGKTSFTEVIMPNMWVQEYGLSRNDTLRSIFNINGQDIESDSYESVMNSSYEHTLTQFFERMTEEELSTSKMYQKAVELSQEEGKSAAQKLAEMYADFNKKLYFQITRIPSTGLNSTSVAKAVGFVNDASSLMLIPTERMEYAGEDFDADSVTTWFHDSKNDVNNNALETIIDITRKPENFKDATAPLTFDDVIEIADNIEGDKKAEDRVMFNDLSSMNEYSKGVHQGKPMVGVAASYFKFWSYLQQTERLRPIESNYQGITIGGQNYGNMIDFEGNRWQSFMKLANVALDNAKYLLLGRINVNTETSGIFTTALTLGIPMEDAVKIMANPFVKGLFSKLDNAKNSIMEQVKGDTQYNSLKKIFKNEFGFEKDNDVTEHLETLAQGNIEGIIDDANNGKEGAQKALGALLWELDKVSRKTTGMVAFLGHLKKIQGTRFENYKQFKGIARGLGLGDIQANTLEKIEQVYEITGNADLMTEVRESEYQSQNVPEWFNELLQKSDSEIVHGLHFMEHLPHLRQAVKGFTETARTKQQMFSLQDSPQIFNAIHTEIIPRLNDRALDKSAYNSIYTKLNGFLNEKYLREKVGIIEMGGQSYDLSNFLDRDRFIQNARDYLETVRDSDAVNPFLNKILFSGRRIYIQGGSQMSVEDKNAISKGFSTLSDSDKQIFWTYNIIGSDGISAQDKSIFDYFDAQVFEEYAEFIQEISKNGLSDLEVEQFTFNYLTGNGNRKLLRKFYANSDYQAPKGQPKEPKDQNPITENPLMIDGKPYHIMDVVLKEIIEDPGIAFGEEYGEYSEGKKHFKPMVVLRNSDGLIITKLMDNMFHSKLNTQLYPSNNTVDNRIIFKDANMGKIELSKNQLNELFENGEAILSQSQKNQVGNRKEVLSIGNTILKTEQKNGRTYVKQRLSDRYQLSPYMNRKITEEAVNRVFFQMKQSFPNIDSEIIDDPSAPLGMVKNGVVYVNIAKAGLDTPWHEFSHIYVAALRDGNTKLYDKLIELARQSKLYNSLYAKYKSKDYSDDDVAEEVVATLTGLFAVGQNIDEYVESSESRSFVKMFLDWVNAILGRVLGKKIVRDNNHTNLGDMIETLANNLKSGNVISKISSQEIKAGIKYQLEAKPGAQSLLESLTKNKMTAVEAGTSFQERALVEGQFYDQYVGETISSDGKTREAYEAEVSDYLKKLRENKSKFAHNLKEGAKIQKDSNRAIEENENFINALGRLLKTKKNRPEATEKLGVIANTDSEVVEIDGLNEFLGRTDHKGEITDSVIVQKDGENYRLIVPITEEVSLDRKVTKRKKVVKGLSNKPQEAMEVFATMAAMYIKSKHPDAKFEDVLLVPFRQNEKVRSVSISRNIPVVRELQRNLQNENDNGFTQLNELLENDAVTDPNNYEQSYLSGLLDGLKDYKLTNIEEDLTEYVNQTGAKDFELMTDIESSLTKRLQEIMDDHNNERTAYQENEEFIFLTRSLQELRDLQDNTDQRFMNRDLTLGTIDRFTASSADISNPVTKWIIQESREFLHYTKQKFIREQKQVQEAVSAFISAYDEQHGVPLQTTLGLNDSTRYFKNLYKKNELGINTHQLIWETDPEWKNLQEYEKEFIKFVIKKLDLHTQNFFAGKNRKNVYQKGMLPVFKTDATRKFLQGERKEAFAKWTDDLSNPDSLRINEEESVFRTNRFGQFAQFGDGMYGSKMRAEALGLEEDASGNYILAENGMHQNAALEENLEVVLNMFLYSSHKLQKLPDLLAKYEGAKAILRYDAMKSQEWKSKPTQDYKALEDIFDLLILNERKSHTNKKLENALDKSRQIITPLQLGLSPASAFSDFVGSYYSVFSNAITASFNNANRSYDGKTPFFTARDMMLASKIVLGSGKYGLGKMSASVSLATNEKINLLLEQTGLYDGDEGTLIRNKRHLVTDRGRLVSRESLLSMQRMSDRNVRAIVLVSQLIHDGLWDYYKVENGELVYDLEAEARDWENTKNLDPKQRKGRPPQIRKTIQDSLKNRGGVEGYKPQAYDFTMINALGSIMAKSMGAFDEGYQGAMEAYSLHKFVFMFKKHIFARINRLWKEYQENPDLSWYDVKEEVTGDGKKIHFTVKNATEEEGLIQTLMHYKNTLKDFGRNPWKTYKNMEGYQKANMKKVFYDILFGVAMPILAGQAIGGLFGGDDEELRRNKGYKALMRQLEFTSMDLYGWISTSSYEQLITPYSFIYANRVLTSIWDLMMYPMREVFSGSGIHYLEDSAKRTTGKKVVNNFIGLSGLSRTGKLMYTFFEK